MTTTTTTPITPPTAPLPAVLTEEDRQTARTVRKTLPVQSRLAQYDAEHEQATAAFGLPISRQEIHERVRRLQGPRPDNVIAAWVFGGLGSIPGLALATGYLPYAWWTMGDCHTTAVLAATAATLACTVGVVVQTCTAYMRRWSRWWNLDVYPKRIPDAALVKLDEAKKTNLFEGFQVVEPAYYNPYTLENVDGGTPLARQRDPWLIGHLRTTHERMVNRHASDPIKASIVLAYWD